MVDASISGEAVMSACGRYRSHLSRWRGRGRLRHERCAVFVMLNPSTADAVRDDPTIRRCIGFARNAGCNGIAVVNLFQLRATEPKALLTADVPLNPAGADGVIEDAMAAARLVIAGWGVLHPRLAWRGIEVRDLAANAGVTLHHLGLTQGGEPRHPLYVKSATRLAVLASEQGVLSAPFVDHKNELSLRA